MKKCKLISKILLLYTPAEAINLSLTDINSRIVQGWANPRSANDAFDMNKQNHWNHEKYRVVKCIAVK
jgi:hypothetical protein